MKKFIYSNSNLSGIGDRLLDIILVLTYANYLGYDEIYLYWRVDNNDMIGDKSYYSKLRREKTSFRGVDYLLNNLQNYITLPSSIIFLKNDELEKLKNNNFIGIGVHDILRNDKYKNAFAQTSGFFVTKFYTCYDIPYINRINDFTFNRNIKLEENKYNEFINKYGKKYILYHEIIENYDKNIKIINLNGISNIFFDMIKILENAIEIHLLDSVWGALIYQLDAKYRLFQSKKIILYAKRGYKEMFLNPIKLDNWEII